MSPPVVIGFVFAFAICMMLSKPMSWNWLRAGADLTSSPPAGSVTAGCLCRHYALRLRMAPVEEFLPYVS